MNWRAVIFVGFAVLAIFLVQRTEGTRQKVVKIESGIAQKCVRHAEAGRARSKPCQRLLDALLKYASPAQREAIAEGVVVDGAKGKGSGLAAPQGRSPGRSDPQGKAKGH